jgi:hypothetical protein
MKLFGWIRRQVRDAVVSGINDALSEVAGLGAESEPEPPPVRLLLPVPPEAPAVPQRRRKVEG